LSERSQKVREAWGKAYAEIAAFYPVEQGSTFERLRDFAPAMAGRVDEAEKAAETASVRWQEGGQGGVQVLINIWRDLWREAIDLLAHG
jgi:hypothetical protein